MTGGLYLTGVDKLTMPHDLTISHLPDVGIVDFHMLSSAAIRPFEPPHRHDLATIADELVRSQCVWLPFLHRGQEDALKNLLRAETVDL